MRGAISRLLDVKGTARARATVGVALVAFTAVWLADTGLDAWIEGQSYAYELANPPPREIWMRLAFAVALTLLWRAHLARRRFRLLFSALDAAPDGVQITEADGTIAYSNRSVREIYGWDPEELRGRHVNAMNADPTFASRVVLPALMSEGRWQGEIEVRHKDGHVFPIWLTTSVVRDVRGRPMAAIGVIRDISQQKRVERETWEYARRLEEATGLKDLFADILRHDLLGPAATVQLSLDSLLRRSPDAEASRKMLETARRSCGKLIEIIEGAAKYAKLSTAQGIEFGTLDLAEVLREVLAEFESRGKERQLRILVDAAGPYPARANRMVGDVFENLLSNAAKYGPEGGTVWIRVDDDGTRWRVSVTDSGEGIPDADKEKVFLRFERLRKEGVKGTGLGLAIARRIVDLHGGRIWVEDAPGRGARFCVSLPKAGSPTPPQPAPGATPPPGRPGPER